MKNDCYFKVGETYVDKSRRQFKVTSIENGIITTDKALYWYGEFYKYFDFEIGSKMYEDLVLINKDPNTKRLIFVFPGGCHVCCDSLMEERGDYRTYALISKEEIKYKEKYKHLLTSEEIERIEKFWKSL